jgi:hypothetical protein
LAAEATEDADFKATEIEKQKLILLAAEAEQRQRKESALKVLIPRKKSSPQLTDCIVEEPPVFCYVGGGHGMRWTVG